MTDYFSAGCERNVTEQLTSQITQIGHSSCLIISASFAMNNVRTACSHCIRIQHNENDCCSLRDLRDKLYKLGVSPEIG